ncbi:hypothetical protein RclHR1_11640011, partial [Rhizophagus clarus]
PELYFEQTIKSGTPLGADYDILKNSFRGGLLPEKVNQVISKVWNSNSKRTVVQKKQTTIFRRSRTQSELKIDLISRQTRFASFQRLLKEFEATKRLKQCRTPLEKKISLNNNISIVPELIYPISTALIIASCDIPGIRKLCEHISALASCHRCEKRANNRNFGGMADMSDWFIIKDPVEHYQKALEWRRCKSNAERKRFVKVNGVRWSEILRLLYFDLIQFVVIDLMHCLFLGIAKWITK